MRSSPNCASISVAPWIVERVNEITQIYSKDKLFYQGKAPKLTEHFRKGEFLAHAQKTDYLIDMLNEIAGIKKPNELINSGLFEVM